mgnify:CR=1 FL=1
MKQFKGHSFHIPVLGIGYSVDAPLKVARYGVTSTVSIVDDILLEQLREKFCGIYSIEYVPIPLNEEDSRAKRITAYLNLLDYVVKEQFNALRSSSFEIEGGIKKYCELLPSYSEIKVKYLQMLNEKDETKKAGMQQWIRDNIYPGDIEANIMTKVDKENYGPGGVPLPVEFNDAHAALRGFARSTLNSSVVFSAGMNPRLYGYVEKFEEFLPSSAGNFSKRITLKVSDYRSALIQGKFLAKKGLWVNEFRIESGLNCGGHAFATEGYLLGPIMEEFKEKREELISSLREIYYPALRKKGLDTNLEKINSRITVQGGVGTEKEHLFLLNHYDVDSVGWGSPFLLVPEVMNVDADTIRRLTEAREEDYYLSDISPLGVPFNSLKGNSKDIEKQNRIEAGRPGSPCAKKYLMFKNDVADKPLCTASIAYIKEIARLKQQSADSLGLQKEYNASLEKACLCEGLAASDRKSVV